MTKGEGGVEGWGEGGHLWIPDFFILVADRFPACLRTHVALDVHPHDCCHVERNIREHGLREV